MYAPAAGISLRLLARTDCYGATTDTFNVINLTDAKSEHVTRDPFKVASFTLANNEAMFKDDIDLFGAEAPAASSVATNTRFLAAQKHRHPRAAGVDVESRTYGELWRRLTAAALGPAESIDFIRAVAAQHA